MLVVEVNMRNIALTALLLLAGPNDCNDDDLVPPAPPGERGIGRNGVAYENPTPTSGSQGPRIESITVGTGGANITVKP
jgi:hypothetical protein